MKTKHFASAVVIAVVAGVTATVGYGWVQQQRSEQLSQAAAVGDLAVVRRCVEAGVDFHRGAKEADGGHGLSPLTVAASTGQVEVVQYLLDQGANPNLRGMSNPLILACWRRNFEVARLLLERGADPNARGEGTPLSVAELTNQQELAALLRAHGARE